MPELVRHDSERLVTPAKAFAACTELFAEVSRAEVCRGLLFMQWPSSSTEGRGSSLFFVFYNNIFLFYILLIYLLGFYGDFV